MTSAAEKRKAAALAGGRKRTRQSSRLKEENHIVLFEELPGTILESILEYVCPRDLLSLCVVSKQIYKYAVARLYKKITISEDQTLICSLKNSPMWTNNYCVIIRSRAMKDLIDVLSKNSTLAAMVSSLNVQSYFARDLLTEFMSYLNLKEFHASGNLKIAPEKAQSLVKATYFLGKHPVYLPNVVELKLIDVHHIFEENSFGKLGSKAVKMGGLPNLKKLSLCQSDSPWDLGKLDDDYPCDKPKQFYAFFSALAENNIKLNLTTLHFQTVTRSNTTKFVELLKSVIDFSNLNTLEVHYDKSYDRDNDRPYNRPSVLDSIAQDMPQLKNLTLNHGCKFTDEEEDAVIRLLKHGVPHQLKTLSIFTFVRSYYGSKKLREAIIDSQSNLVKLAVEDREDIWSRYCKKEIDESRSRRNTDTKRIDKVMPRFFEIQRPAPFFNHELIKRYKLRRDVVGTNTMRDPIMKASSDKLPHLTEYRCTEIVTDVKRRCFLINGAEMTFKCL